MSEQAFPAAPPRRGCSPLTIVLAGCGTVLLLGVICIGVITFVGYRWTMRKMDEFVTKYEEKGYEHVSGQMIDETQPIEASRVYTAQTVIIREDVEGDLAIMSQSAEIHGTVSGDIDFLGQMLIIHPDAVVTGDIRVEMAQVVQVRGTVEGEVTGSWQVLDRPEESEPPEPGDVDPQGAGDTGEGADEAADVDAETELPDSSAVDTASLDVALRPTSCLC